METKNDEILKDFFANNKSEIQDNGFTESVLNQLPRKKVKQAKWLVPVFTLLGIVVSTLFIDFNKLISEIYFSFLQLPLFYYVCLVLTIPVVVLLLFFFAERQNKLQ